MVVILAGTNDVGPDRTLCGDGGNWDTFHNVAQGVRSRRALTGPRRDTGAWTRSMVG